MDFGAFCTVTLCAQQEEEQIQHDEESDDDLECGLADIDGLSGPLAPPLALQPIQRIGAAE
jgi:hypothetical protein